MHKGSTGEGYQISTRTLSRIQRTLRVKKKRENNEAGLETRCHSLFRSSLCLCKESCAPFKLVCSH